MENNYNFTQEITLPSQGLLNPEIPEGKVVQRCMMVADQKFLSGSNRDPGNSLNQLIQRTITSPESFDVDNLTLSDTLYLLFKLRILSYGNTYKFRTRCPECGKKIDITVDLSEIPVDTLEEGYAENLIVELPHRGDTVYTKILTNADINYINKEVSRRKKKGQDVEGLDYLLRIVYSIEKIVLKKDKEEITHPVDIEKYVSSLTDLDASSIILARDSAVFGISPSIDYVCPECRQDIEVGIQFSGNFFRATPIR